MKLSRRHRREWRIFLIMSALAAVVSAWFGYNVAPPERTTAQALISGVVNSLLIATPILLFELMGSRPEPLRRLRRLPLLAYLGLKVLFYAVVILGGLTLAPFLMDFPDESLADETFGISLIFATAMSLSANLVIEMGRLLGYGTLRSLLTGRYVQPHAEQRVFLLIDMKGSTTLAERLGALRFHALLNDFFRDITEAALECDGEIHKYVGDEAILTWPAGDALTGGDCLACPFVARDLIASNAGKYLARFGVVPEFRASLHCGEIVTGEIGDMRREIAHVGDTLNVAARLLEAAKELGRDVLVSADLLAAAPLPAGLTVEPLPMLAVRGREQPLAIAALNSTGS
ncbi:MAG: adenylate/guanylate cyclase domain-containing protein [Reyranella sp.]|nr:MAG: adenylate/guanylate cyclase domain-containing protein [Reyranella sp.]